MQRRPQFWNGSEAIDQTDGQNMRHLAWFLSLLLFVVVCRTFGPNSIAPPPPPIVAEDKQREDESTGR